MLALIAALAAAASPVAATASPPALAPSALGGMAGPAEASAAGPSDEWLLEQAETRMTVPVSIGDRGAWPFVIDTGAERTVVSHELAASLALAPGRTLRVTTMAGTAPTPTALVPMLRVSKLTPSNIEAPLYARRNLGASGLLGLDALQGHKVEIDFADDRMTLIPSTKRSRVMAQGRDEIVVVARSLFGQLIVTDARWRGRRISVVIDTGSAVTIANSAFLKLIRSGGTRAAEPLGNWNLIAATGEAVPVAGYRLDNLEIGRMALSDLPVAVADVAPFARFGLVKRPALMLGMDTLRSFKEVEIDFPNRAIRFTVPGPTRMARLD
ncbi:hypothetical protein GCM10011380_12350 [Sphingomonas metalli]|uniref:Peptidase A2 domain-containing protein n=1 Tax=Sphingomonas metalli TaxID=1779358 RepID=A0A916SZG0_9SPHN|nr:aspartyl protease family protein [Sphingomonas metalli]GGB24335.1 hypothetical protein GCM10011380_12350 [Sphingomonas metalli]